jgi:hypothetical protein
LVSLRDLKFDNMALQLRQKQARKK